MASCEWLAVISMWRGRVCRGSGLGQERLLLVAAAAALRVAGQQCMGRLALRRTAAVHARAPCHGRGEGALRAGLVCVYQVSKTMQQAMDLLLLLERGRVLFRVW